MVRQSVTELPTDDALSFIGELVDLSLDVRNTDGLRRAVALSAELQQRALDRPDVGHLHYLTGNAWSNLRALANAAQPWEGQELERAIFHLRSALSKEEWIAALPKPRACQVLTNLANTLSDVGRVVEAVELWEQASDQVPGYGMTIGSKGYGLFKYSYVVPDPGHARFIMAFARHDLVRAAGLPLESDRARTFFKERIAEADSALGKGNLRKPAQALLNSSPLGRGKQEIRYRKWCLKHRLFLNPLNDLGEHSIAARDRLTLPPMLRPINEGPMFHGLFNQLKQEFTSARFFYYEGLQPLRAHFADRGVYQHNTLDYPSYSVNVEKIKAAFRISYSVVDKIAFFVNAYFELAVKPRRVSFRSIWYTDQERAKGVRPDIQSQQNWPLRALFWVGKDLSEDRPEFVESMAPGSQLLATVRNHLEHQYLKLHEGDWSGPTSEPTLEFMKDSLALSLYRRDFEEKTLRILKLVRAALIYLVCTVRVEELRRKKEHGSKPIGPCQRL